MTDRIHSERDIAVDPALVGLPGYARRPSVALRWPLLSPADIQLAGNDSDLLAVRIVERYGISQDWAVREVAEWLAWDMPRLVS